MYTHIYIYLECEHTLVKVCKQALHAFISSVLYNQCFNCAFNSPSDYQAEEDLSLPVVGH